MRRLVFVCALSLLLLALLGNVLFFLIPEVEAAAMELLFAEDFDTLSTGTTPHSFEWATQDGVSFYNRTDCYFEVVNTVRNSVPNSLILNDTQGATTVYGLIKLDVDLFSHTNGKVQIFFRVNSTTTYPLVQFCQHFAGYKVAAQFYFKNDGNISYYDSPAWKNMDTYLVNTWYNVTTVFTAGGVDYYVNGVQKVVGCGFQDAVDINQIYLLMTNPVIGFTNIVYLDDIRVDGEKITQTFYQTDTGKAWISTDSYRAEIYTQTTSAYKGQIRRLAVKSDTHGSWINTVTVGTPNLFWSESYYPPAGGGTQVGIADIAGGTITVTNTSDTVEYYTTVQDSYFNFTNTLTFFKDYPYIAYTCYRKMNFSDDDTSQKQVDFLFSPLEINKYYYTNSSGVYSDTNDFSGTVTTTVSSPNTYFPFYGYCMQQNHTIASIITYPYDTGGWLCETLNTWNTYGSAYSEWEISFGQCASQGGTPTIQDQIEEVGGVLAIYQGDEASTNSVQSLSESLFSDWSGNRTYLGRLIDSDDALYTTSTGTIESTTYASDQLTVTINATSGQDTNTQVYYGSLNEPSYILNQAYDLDDYAATTICTCNMTHSSTEDLVISWVDFEGIYIQSTEADITEAPTLTGNEFTLTMTGVGTTTTEIYIPTDKGRPYKVFIENNEYNEPHYWTYDGSTRIVTITWTHSSPAVIKLKWKGGGMGLYNLNVHVTQGGYPTHAIINVEGKNYTCYALHNFKLPYDTYDVTCYCDGTTQTKTVGLFGDTSIGFNFTGHPLSPKPSWLWSLPILIIIGAALFILFRRK